jgi:chromosome segregation ATPase
MNEWMKVLDPSFNAKEETALAERLEAAEREIESKNEEIRMLEMHLQEQKLEYKSKVDELQYFCTNLTSNLSIIKDQLLIEHENLRKKDDEIAVLTENNAKMSELVSTLEERAKEPKVFPEAAKMEAEISALKEQIATLQGQLQQKEEAEKAQAEQVSKLNLELQAMKQKAEDKSKMIEEQLFQLDEQQSLVKTHESKISWLNEMLANRTEELNNTQAVWGGKLKEAEDEIRNKDFAIEELNDKVKSLEEELNLSKANLDLINDKLKYQREELAEKNKLITEHLNNKPIQEEDGSLFKIFGRSESKEQLASAKRASLAHQLHNA